MLAAHDLRDLRQAFATMRSETGLRQREAAAALNLAEAQVLDVHVGLNSGALRAARLRGCGADFAAVLAGLQECGPVMALTRNETAVHEKTGVYCNLSHEGRMGLALGEQIDLRLFYQQWQYGYAVTEYATRGLQHSLQFFDASGTAVHKVFAKSPTRLNEFQVLVETFTDSQQRPSIEITPQPVPLAAPADNAVDVLAFQQAWLVLTDTHQFFGLLKKFKLTRTHAMRLAPPGYALRLQNTSVRIVLQQASAQQLDIMVFVGNPGCIQIHTGPIHHVKTMGVWLNIMDADFNLHLREDLVVQSWLVRKPTSDGIVTSLELYDGEGGQIATFFGKRKPGVIENPAWPALLAQLPDWKGVEYA
jgi:putative hemin transport protein